MAIKIGHKQIAHINYVDVESEKWREHIINAYELVHCFGRRHTNSMNYEYMSTVASMNGWMKRPVLIGCHPIQYAHKSHEII